MSPPFTAISLFSGAIGLDLGLKSTGRFGLRACVEKEPALAETIRRNRAAGKLPAGLAIFEADIRDLDPADVLAAARSQDVPERRRERRRNRRRDIIGTFGQLRSRPVPLVPLLAGVERAAKSALSP